MITKKKQTKQTETKYQ